MISDDHNQDTPEDGTQQEDLAAPDSAGSVKPPEEDTGLGKVVPPESAWGTDYEGKVQDLQSSDDIADDLDDEMSDFDDLDDLDIDYDQSDDDWLDDPTAKKKKKLLPAVLVLSVVAGIGGYIALNPEIIRQTSPSPSPDQEMAAVVRPAPAIEKETSAPSVSGEPQSTPLLGVNVPQPSVSENEVLLASDEQVTGVTEIKEISGAAAAPPQSGRLAAFIEDQGSASGDTGSMDESDQDTRDVVNDAVTEDQSDNGAQGDGGALSLTLDAVPDDNALVPDDRNAAPESLPEEFIAEEEEDVAAAAPVDEAPFTVAQADILPPAEFDSVEESGDVITPMPEVFPETEPEPVAEVPLSMPEALPQPNPEIRKLPVQSVADKPKSPPRRTTNPENEFYDSDYVLPKGAVASTAGPREVKPSVEYGSRLVVHEEVVDADSPEALLVSANRALKLGRYSSALDMFETLYKGNARDPRILMGRAVALQSTGRTETALKTYDELLEVQPGNADAMLNMLGILKTQYPSVALRRLMTLHETHPHHAGIAAQIGITNGELGYYEDAYRFLGIAASIEPENPQHLFNMAILADRQGDVRKAVDFYEEALQRDAMYGAGRDIPRETIYDRLSVLRRR